MKAADYLAEKRARKGKAPTQQETARDLEIELRRMGFTDKQAHGLRVECDKLGNKGAKIRDIEKYIRGQQRAMQRARAQEIDLSALRGLDAAPE